MTEHSKAFEDKKAKLEKAESDLRKSIDSESDNLEVTAIKYLKIGAAISTAVLVSYGVYRLILKKDTEDKEEEKVSGGPSMMDRVVDKVTDVVAGLAAQNISNYLDKLKENVEKDLKR